MPASGRHPPARPRRRAGASADQPQTRHNVIEPVPEHARSGPEWDALRSVIDPELGVNIVDLGLVYGLERDGDLVRLQITMTTPACPLTGVIEDDVDAALKALKGVAHVDLEWVWEPPWDPSMMSDSARMLLGR